MSTKQFNNVPILKHVDPNSGKQIKKLISLIERKYHKKFADYWDFHKWTIDNVDKFWEEIWHFSGVIASKIYDKVIDLSLPMMDSEWFAGAKLNIAENLLKYRDDHIALICTGESKETQLVTYAEMYEESRKYALALRRIGVKKGDRVVCYMSNRKEPIFAMIAVTSIGAIWSAALPLLGTQAVLNRLQLITPKVLITIDRFQHNKEEINMLPKISEIVKGLPSLEKVIIVNSKKESKLRNIDTIPNSCDLDEFLEITHPDQNNCDFHFEQVSFSYPAFISFTSGTTGLPKALIHGFGNLLISCRDYWVHGDATRDSIWFTQSPAGWSSWNMMAALTFTGLTILLYEGVPYFHSPTYLWDMIDRFNVTHLFLPANILDDLSKKGYAPGPKNNLNSLKCIYSGGSIVKAAGYDFIYEKVKKQVAFSSIYGSTELIGMCLILDHTIPIYRGEIPTPCLGTNLECVDEAGRSVIGKIGELLVTTPSPGLLVGLWNDENKTLFQKAYFTKYPGKFSTGDHAIINPITRGFLICGRSDDTLKQRGTRFGSIEIYNILDTIPEIRNSICVSQYNKEMDERAVLFIKMQNGAEFNKEFIEKVKNSIENQLTKEHIPEVILETQDIPYNVSGKKMENIIKKIINNMPYNTEAVVNSDCLKNFINIPQLQNFV